MKIINKKGQLTFADEWRRQKVVKISSDGIIEKLKTNACTTQTYFPTCANAHVWDNCAYGSGKGSESIFEFFWKAKA
jgi:hypothetical protein